MSYYKLHKEKMIENQMNYYRENRDKYIEYMKVYNHLYYIKRKSERPLTVPKQRIKKEKALKQRVKKEKVPKQRNEKNIESKPIDTTQNTILPTLFFKGEYILSFN